MFKLGGAAAGALALAACSSSSKKPATSSASGTSGSGSTSASSGAGTTSAKGKVSFLYFGSATLDKAVEAEYAPFVTANPGIKFSAQGIAANSWADFANTVSTRIAGGSAPDVIDIATEGVGIFRSKKLVIPLDKYIAQDKAIIDDYYADLDPKLKKISDQFGNPGGVTYYIPGGYNTNLLYCNTDVFNRAGVDLPGEEDWTWDDFTAAAKKIKAKTGAYIAPFLPNQFQEILPWLFTNGASVLSADWSKATINSPEAAEAAAYCRMMHVNGYAPDPGGTYNQPTLLAQGKLACYPAGRSGTTDVKSVGIVDKVQIVKWPKKTQNGSPVGWDNFPILSSSHNQDAAWDFVKYLTTKEAATSLLKLGGTNIPARLSIANSDAFLVGAPKGSELLPKALDYATPVEGPAKGAAVQMAVETTWLQMLRGALTPEKAVAQIGTTISGLL